MTTITALSQTRRTWYRIYSRASFIALNRSKLSDWNIISGAGRKVKRNRIDKGVYLLGRGPFGSWVVELTFFDCGAALDCLGVGLGTASRPALFQAWLVFTGSCWAAIDALATRQWLLNWQCVFCHNWRIYSSDVIWKRGVLIFSCYWCQMDVSADTGTFGHRGCERLDPFEVNLDGLGVSEVIRCNLQARPRRGVVGGSLDWGLKLAWLVSWLYQAHSTLYRRWRTSGTTL